jgi:hypothetical protein
VDLPPVLWIPGFAALGGTEDGGDGERRLQSAE